ncbi:chorismate mutase [Streptomyces beihaiensis]|uniref:chorismate mutase n=1 Tax=Streptomyces beihaiensis TaxID=2984495 RepID=A0ABT3U0B3_9ACTN|nr:chorismate mutase [Streptomyces beihaiensis]MCX3062752.1 chorismate mutase [Streptomyces beihaiensis]
MAVTSASAAPASEPSPAGARAVSHAAPRAQAAVASLAAERVALADKVAAAKYGTDKPIDDPARERQILAEVAARSAALGIDPAYARAVFRDQMEANKLVQRGLYARWDAHPDERPTHRPDLATQVRPALDRITTRLLDALRDMAPARASAGCEAVLEARAARAARTDGFDTLHVRGLARALPSVCSGQAPPLRRPPPLAPPLLGAHASGERTPHLG